MSGEPASDERPHGRNGGRGDEVGKPERRRGDPTWELGEEADRFDEAEPGTLAEQAPLHDADGDDVRQYTGEPVETEDGWVVPVKQAIGEPDPDERE